MDRLTERQQSFINEQILFLVATAAPEGRVNVSPKALDTLRVVDERRIVWLNLSGSGNETAAHVAANGRMTLMFMSFTEDPLILRVYGTASVAHPRDDHWPELVSMFPKLGGTRQIFDLSIENVSVSCGTSIPVMTVESVRADTELEPFYAAMPDEDLHAYWAKKNVESIDGLPTRILAD